MVQQQRRRYKLVNIIREGLDLFHKQKTMASLEQNAERNKSSAKKIITIVLISIVVIAFAIFWWNYLFVFGEGVKSGQLNYVVKKGNFFKTYEGKLIQSGFRSQETGSIQSYEFEFSVADDSLANVLMNNSGNYYDLHYKEYKHTLPWRGYSRYIVDEIVKMHPAP